MADKIINPYTRHHYLHKYQVDLNSKIQLAEELVKTFTKHYPGIKQYAPKDKKDT